MNARHHVGYLQTAPGAVPQPPAVPNPKDNVTQFSNAWNELRNAVLGRGTAPPPNVPPALAERVGNAYERWRAFIAGVGPTATVLQVSVLAPWVLEYRALANEAKAAKLTFAEMPETLIEDVTQVVHNVASGAKALLLLAAIGGPLVLLSLSMQRRRA